MNLYRSTLDDEYRSERRNQMLRIILILASVILNIALGWEVKRLRNAADKDALDAIGRHMMSQACQ